MLHGSLALFLPVLSTLGQGNLLHNFLVVPRTLPRAPRRWQQCPSNREQWQCSELCWKIPQQPGGGLLTQDGEKLHGTPWGRRGRERSVERETTVGVARRRCKSEDRTRVAEVAALKPISWSISLRLTTGSQSRGWHIRRCPPCTRAVSGSRLLPPEPPAAGRHQWPPRPPARP